MPRSDSGYIYSARVRDLTARETETWAAEQAATAEKLRALGVGSGIGRL
jgi:hypothetical protein